MKIDFLIVGQGLAGTILAHTLQQRGCRVVVADELREATASKVAAGLLNPVAGKRVGLSWKAAELVPVAHAFYRQLEQVLESRFFYPMPLVRLFSSIEDQNNWLARSADPQVGQFLEETSEACRHPLVKQPFGSIAVKGGGYADLRTMLGLFRQHLQRQQALLEGPFSYDNVQAVGQEVTYRHLQAKAIIFCEGYRVQQNPWFGWMPIVPTKGEVLDLAGQNLNLSCLYNKAVYMVPQGPGQVRVGATYDWRSPNEENTAEGIVELVQKAGAMVEVPLQVQKAYAGIRPAVRDRKPLIGRHPELKQFVTFNGMGSKGVLMAPFFAAQLADLLLDGKAVYKEVDISRYYSLLPATN